MERCIKASTRLLPMGQESLIFGTSSGGLKADCWGRVASLCAAEAGVRGRWERGAKGGQLGWSAC